MWRLAILLTLAGCGSAKARELTVADACQLANDGATVTVNAYLWTPVMIGECQASCSVLLVPTPEYNSTTITVTLPTGKGALTMAPIAPGPNLSEVGAGAFQVTDSDNALRRIGDRVRATGTLAVKREKLQSDPSMKPIEVTTCALAVTALHAAPER
ncbi:MAG: hypothetical protein K8W52_19940 [Deltaproteobacteria bacterium]|nr:hypothetical protein [Deltaproteobacteria bacterium]